MRRMVSLALLLAAVACTTDNAGSTDSAKAATADTMAPTESVSDAVGKVRTAWKEAADRKDSTAVASFYEDDAVMIVTGAPVANGRGEIVKAIGRMVNLTKINSIDSKEVSGGGDVAYDYGTYSQDAPDATGKMVTRTGYYVVTLHKQADGSWKIRRHIDNVPIPAPSR